MGLLHAILCNSSMLFLGNSSEVLLGSANGYYMGLLGNILKFTQNYFLVSLVIFCGVPPRTVLDILKVISLIYFLDFDKIFFFLVP